MLHTYKNKLNILIKNGVLVCSRWLDFGSDFRFETGERIHKRSRQCFNGQIFFCVFFVVLVCKEISIHLMDTRRSLRCRISTQQDNQNNFPIQPNWEKSETKNSISFQNPRTRKSFFFQVRRKTSEKQCYFSFKIISHKKRPSALPSRV